MNPRLRALVLGAATAGLALTAHGATAARPLPPEVPRIGFPFTTYPYPPTTPEGLANQGILIPVPLPGSFPSAVLEADGTLAAIDSDSLRVVRPGQPDLELNMPKQLTVLLDGEPVTVSQVPIGGSAHIQYAVHGSKRVVTDLDVATPVR